MFFSSFLGESDDFMSLKMFRYCAFEIGVDVHCTGVPVLFLPAQFSAIVQFDTKSVHFADLQVLQFRDFPRYEFCCYRCSHIRFVFCFNANSRAEGVEFRALKKVRE